VAEIGNLEYFRRELDSFIAAAKGEREVEISATHARDIMKLIAACYESSAEHGREVKLA
jgi:predicted dehydrogenase